MQNVESITTTAFPLQGSGVESRGDADPIRRKESGMEVIALTTTILVLAMVIDRLVR
jgi:hypothetical protein